MEEGQRGICFMAIQGAFVKKSLLIAVLFGFLTVYALPGSRVYATPTVLSPGDIALVGFNFDDPDELAFVLLRNIGSGTQISFTDNGWLSSNAFRTGEGVFTWTAPSDLAAGTVVKPAVSGVAFSTSGDQILAYQGAASNAARVPEVGPA